MKVMLVRVLKGDVLVGNEVVSSIKKGLAVFTCIEKDDDSETLKAMVERIIAARVFEDQDGKLNLSIKETGDQILCIPNFTLCADTKAGNRPSFDKAMRGDFAKPLFEQFVAILKTTAIIVETGVFGVYMKVRLEFDGPVNIMLDSRL
ncbi:MAG: D-aminoacyl-tRNA deacylase [Candidatus Omnitrophica bacterium]|nr:D-aminoacyl-tRNA deacylase [Candidatus Omnitrophota bacterium]